LTHLTQQTSMLSMFTKLTAKHNSVYSVYKLLNLISRQSPLFFANTRSVCFNFGINSVFREIFDLKE